MAVGILKKLVSNKKKVKDNYNTDKLHEEVKLAKRALVDAKYTQVMSAAERLLKSEDIGIRQEALRLSGLVYFKTGNYQRAEKYFKELVKQSNSSSDWFNYAIILLYSGETKESEITLDRAIEFKNLPENEHGPSPAFMYYQYASNLSIMRKYSLAIKPLNRLKKIYSDLVITDDNFLYIRKVPCLRDTLDVCSEVFVKLGDKELCNRWFRELADNIDKDGKELLFHYKKNLLR